MKKKRANRKRMIEELGKHFVDLLIETPTDQLYKVYPAIYESLVKEKIIIDAEKKVIPLF